MKNVSEPGYRILYLARRDLLQRPPGVPYQEVRRPGQAVRLQQYVVNCIFGVTCAYLQFPGRLVILHRTTH
jgi:hypothetical protein